MIDETTGREVVEFDGGRREITGTLTEAVRTPSYLGKGRDFLSGFVRGDRHGRFPDGRRINTSFITREVAPDVFLTRSDNLYRVESWAPEPAQN